MIDVIVSQNIINRKKLLCLYVCFPGLNKNAYNHYKNNTTISILAFYAIVQNFP